MDGEWSVWGLWGSCDGLCGRAVRNRTRLCNQPSPEAGGIDCPGSSTEIGVCDTGVNCPSKKRGKLVREFPALSFNFPFSSFLSVDGDWSSWQPWGHCLGTCGKGEKNRTRDCSSPASQFGGQACCGDALEKDLCDTAVPCPGNNQLIPRIYQSTY